MYLYKYLTKVKNYTDEEAKKAIFFWENDLPQKAKWDKDCFEWWNITWKGEKNGQRLERTKNKTN